MTTLRRPRPAVLVLVLVLALVGALVLVAYVGVNREQKAAPKVASSAPANPYARVCSDERTLSGPAGPPEGAVIVKTSQKLNAVTKRHPAGTTFWLRPGVHKLGRGPYEQVVPKKGNVYVGAPGAVLDGQNRNFYAFSGNDPDVTIKYLTIENFGARGSNGNEGVVNHDSARHWTVEHNTIRKNAGAGVMIGDGNTIRANCISRNGQYGFNAYSTGRLADIRVVGNEISDNNTDDWERRIEGCGCTGGGKFWMVDGAVVRDNWVHDNRGVGLWADMNNRGFTIENNFIEDNDAEGIFYEASYNAKISDNTFAGNGLVKGPKSNDFPTGAIYLSESGADDRVPGPYGDTLEVSGNVFKDNWSGVILWENSDRFAGSPANTSTGVGTLVNPKVATAKSCNARNIESKPYVDDCRWKTQNVHVHDNTFSFDPKAISGDCDADHGCGFNGIFANWGTFPDWSPYKEKVVQNQITFEQGNKFYRNTYNGRWSFIVHGQGQHVSWANWQSAPYEQDTDSVIRPAPETVSPTATGD